MRRVAIVGVGLTPRNESYMRLSDTKSWKDYVIEAAYGAIDDVPKGLDPQDIQYAVVNYHGEASVEAGGIGPIVSDILGLHPIGVTALCANCVGAGVGMHEAFGLVASGRYDRVLAVGFDKRWDLLNFGDKRAIGGDVDYDFHLGFDHPTLQGLLQVYAYKRWGRNKVLKAMASYRMQSVWWGSRNPNAAQWGVKSKTTLEHLHGLIEETPEEAHVPAEFWALLPHNYAVEGASSMILVPADDAGSYTDNPIYVDGISYKCNSHLLSKQMYYPIPALEQYDMCDFAACHVATEEAYEMARVKPQDIDFAELFESHITSLVPTLAATGVPEPDKVLDFIINGETGPGGRLPTGTDGGRGGFGLTSGSNFSDGIYEAVQQMRGKAGERQLKKADTAVITGMQGEMASAAVAILRNH
jgi:acetyl-CoA C-acetyltransferase